MQRREMALEMDANDGVPLLLRRVHEHAVTHESRVVDEDVEPAEVARDARDHFPDDVRIRNIGLIGPGLAAGLLDLGNHRFGFGLRAVVIDRDARALFRQHLRDGGADIPSASRHQRDASLEVTHQLFLLI